MAYQPAVLGTARLNNFRLGFVSTRLELIRFWRVAITIDGESARERVRVGSLDIRDILNDSPNTATWRMDGAPPPVPGMQVRITLGSDTPRLLFNGAIETVALSYEGKPAQIIYACSAIDDTARANLLRPFALYEGVSASTVATDLVAQFAPSLTANHVEAGLPTITVGFDGSEGFNGCLRAICKLIGGYFYWDDGDLHLFLEEATDAPDPIDDAVTTLYHDPAIAAVSDDSQLRTRVYGRGFGTTLLCDVDAAEDILPVDNAAMFTAGGGSAVVSATPDGALTDRITYADTQVGGAGTLVGPGVYPSVLPVVAAAQGSGLGSGAYYYAYTFVTAAGESLPGPVAGIITGAAVPGPAGVLTGSYSNSGGPPYPFAVGDTIRYWAYTLTTAAGETLPSATWAPSVPYPLGGAGPYLCGVNLPLGPPGTTGRKLYRTAMASAQLKLVATIADNTTPSYLDTIADGALGANVPTSSTAGTLNAAVISSIALGPAAVTTRKVYRTAVNGSQLKLLYVIFDNTTSGATTDTIADGSLGANVVTSDTSALAQVDGQVNPGSSSIITAGVGSMPTSGWVISAGGELIRYTNISGNTLGGIPLTGNGRIQTALLYGDQLLPAAGLTGIALLGRPLSRGAKVHVFVQRDDFTAQAAAAARESTASYSADGIHEHLIIDERRAEPSLTALCDAELARFANPLVTVAYVSSDVKTRSGKPIVVDLTTPAIDDTLVIQDVTITQIDVGQGVPARFQATASTVKFRLEDLLRRMSALLPE